MKRQITYLIIAFFLALAFVSCSKEKPTNPADYVNFKVGNQWTYSVETLYSGRAEKKKSTEVTLKITGMEDIDGVSCYIKETLAGQKPNPREYFEVNPQKGLILRKQGYYIYNAGTKKLEFTETKMEPPEVMLQFPLNVGASWTRKTKRGNNEMNAVFLVKGEEEIEIPAGKFKALKIEVHGGTTVGGEFSAYQWYVKDVGRVKDVVEAKSRDGIVKSISILKEFKAKK